MITKILNRISIINFVVLFQIFCCANLYSQINEKDCINISVLKQLSLEEKTELTNLGKDIVNSQNPNREIKKVYCPPTELHFKNNCAFPFDYYSVKYYLAMLFYDPKINLILESNSDNLSYKKNPKNNLLRAENVKNIFVFYGINTERIEIIDLKDTWQIATNKTKLGREENIYIRMKLSM